ncbi:MAG: hypothetical protein B6I30_01975 [Desulfobacteraceae bacterium 4572_187]|nr:MAG: hypothetical protein B6I30_01975 [Desulfobacteraceae bacterium 4572_187]
MFEFSIIIPFQVVTPYLLETLSRISELNEREFEVILLPDQALSEGEIGSYAYHLRIVPTGAVSPAVKRDMGAEKCKGKFVAFIDDDAFPDKDWLKNARRYLTKKKIVAACGPQITPENDGFWQQVSGAVFLSPLNGKAVCRYWPCKKKFFVDDWPSVNLILRKKEFLKVGGFDSYYWPGEDTKLCLDLLEQTGEKILYAPDVRVYHHRRPGFLKHMRQIGNYGLHRGFFAKSFPKTSFRIAYFVPSLFFIFVFLGWLCFFGPAFLRDAYLFLWLAYIILQCVSIYFINKKISNFKVALASLPYLVCTHFWYGWRFIKGFVFVSDLKSKLGR